MSSKVRNCQCSLLATSLSALLFRHPYIKVDLTNVIICQICVQNVSSDALELASTFQVNFNLMFPNKNVLIEHDRIAQCIAASMFLVKRLESLIWSWM